jgi:actin-related protein
LPENPDTYSWTGMSHFYEDQIRAYGINQALQQTMVSKKDYQEYGHNYVNRKFDEAANKLS